MRASSGRSREPPERPCVEPGTDRRQVRAPARINGARSRCGRRAHESRARGAGTRGRSARAGCRRAAPSQQPALAHGHAHVAQDLIRARGGPECPAIITAPTIALSVTVARRRASSSSRAAGGPGSARVARGRPPAPARRRACPSRERPPRSRSPGRRGARWTRRRRRMLLTRLAGFESVLT
jgi:hypothetical protein